MPTPSADALWVSLLQQLLSVNGLAVTLLVALGVRMWLRTERREESELAAKEDMRKAYLQAIQDSLQLAREQADLQRRQLEETQEQTAILRDLERALSSRSPRAAR